MKTIKITLFTVATALGIIPMTGMATTVINYDGINGNYVTNGKALDSTNFHLPTPVDTGGTRTWKYSDTTPISPTLAQGYSGPAIYAALQTSNTNAQNFAWFSGIGTHPVVAPYSTFSLGGETDSTLTALVFFKPSVGLGETVSMTMASSITFTVVGAGTDPTFANQTRLALLNDSTWYVSGDIHVISEVTNTPDLNTLTWAAFDPINQAPLPLLPNSGYTNYATGFTNIQAAGYYIGGVDRTGSQPYMYLQDFNVNATIVPEPAVNLMLLLSMFALAAKRWKC